MDTFYDLFLANPYSARGLLTPRSEIRAPAMDNDRSVSENYVIIGHYYGRFMIILRYSIICPISMLNSLGVHHVVDTGHNCEHPAAGVRIQHIKVHRCIQSWQMSVNAVLCWISPSLAVSNWPESTNVGITFNSVRRATAVGGDM